MYLPGKVPLEVFEPERLLNAITIENKSKHPTLLLDVVPS